jgi:nitroimidazol reductase NimA-like FMN-containing flavoprotein (pyridoxamine 5'-phosphate oxidase superfamily)
MPMTATKRANPRIDRPRFPAGYGVPKSAKGLLAWDHVEQRLADAKVYWIATVANGEWPRVRPVDGLYIDGAVYVGGSPETRWVQDIQANPNVSLHLDGGYDVVILEGVIGEERPDAELARRLAAASNAKYPEYGMKPSDYEGPGVRAVRPRRAFAWKAFPKDATRFRFEP